MAGHPTPWPEWRHLCHGKVRHAVRHNTAATAVCGTGPAWFDRWRGKYGQAERERNATLRPCRRCIAKGATP